MSFPYAQFADAKRRAEENKGSTTIAERNRIANKFHDQVIIVKGRVVEVDDSTRDLILKVRDDGADQEVRTVISEFRKSPKKELVEQILKYGKNTYVTVDARLEWTNFDGTPTFAIEDSEIRDLGI